MFQTIGYVYTLYGKRPLSEVKAEIEKYFQWYDVNGIFLDETSENDESYYHDIADFVRGIEKSNLVVLNPGTIPSAKAYFDFADLVWNNS